VAELINTAFETVVDRISTEQHALSKKAKDVGSIYECHMHTYG
jgi:diacylglycerol kinase (ATP)